MKKKRIAVLFGGCSTEYQVSLQSAYAVMSQIDTSLYDLIPIGLERHTGKWFWYRGELYEIPKTTGSGKRFAQRFFCLPEGETKGFLFRKTGGRLCLSMTACLP